MHFSSGVDRFKECGDPRKDFSTHAATYNTFNVRTPFDISKNAPSLPGLSHAGAARSRRRRMISAVEPDELHQTFNNVTTLFIRFRNTAEAQVPVRMTILLLGNSATHEHPKVQKWLARHPRWTFHFTPTSAFWSTPSKASSPNSRKDGALSVECSGRSPTFRLQSTGSSKKPTPIKETQTQCRPFPSRSPVTLRAPHPKGKRQIKHVVPCKVPSTAATAK